MKIECSVEELKQLLKTITLKEGEIKATLDSSSIAKSVIDNLNKTIKENKYKPIL